LNQFVTYLFFRALDIFKTTFPKNKTSCRFIKYHLTTHYGIFIREFGSLHAIDSGHGERQQKLMKKLYKNTTRRKGSAIGELGVRLSMLDSVLHLQESFDITTEGNRRRVKKRADFVSKAPVGKQLSIPIGPSVAVTHSLTRGNGWEMRLHKKLRLLTDGTHDRAAYYMYLELLKLVRDEIIGGGRNRPSGSIEAFVTRYDGALWER
jgi:hypothetical protein